MMSTGIPASLCLALMVWVAAAVAQDHELRLVTNLVEKGVAGEAVWLHAGGNEFLALFAGSGETARNRAVIILHSLGTHADWPEVVSPLRRALPGTGWSTLSLQLPVFPPGVTLSEYGGTLGVAADRINSGVTYLQDKGYSRIIIIGYGFGTAAAMTYIARKPGTVRAFVGISMQSWPFLSPSFDLPGYLKQLKVPVLDIYGSQDYAEVYRTADDRRLAGGKNGSRSYHQVVINGANHYYTDLEEELANRIVNWLEKLPDVEESVSD